MSATTKSKTSKTPTEALATTRLKELSDAATFEEAITASAAESSALVASIEAEWATGVATSSSTEWRQATDEVHRDSILKVGAARRRKFAQGRQVNLDRELAEMLRPTILRAYPIASNSVDTVEPSEGPETLPHLSFVQLAATEHLGSGNIQGVVDVRLHRDDMHAPLTTERLNKYLAADGIGASIGSGYDKVWSTPINGGAIDHARIEVTSAFAQVPVITNPSTDANAELIARNVADKLEDHFATHGFGKVPNYPVRVRSTGKVSSSVTKEGKVYATVQLDLTAKASPNSFSQIDARVSEAAKELVGSAYAGLGRVTSAELIGMQSTTNQYNEVAARQIGVDVVLVSQTA